VQIPGQLALVDEHIDDLAPVLHCSMSYVIMLKANRFGPNVVQVGTIICNNSTCDQHYGDPSIAAVILVPPRRDICFRYVIWMNRLHPIVTTIKVMSLNCGVWSTPGFGFFGAWDRV
jgi:hypothetical protein